MYDGSTNVDSRKDVPFLGFVDIVPHLEALFGVPTIKITKVKNPRWRRLPS